MGVRLGFNHFHRMPFFLRSVPTALAVGLGPFWGSLLASIALGGPGVPASALPSKRPLLPKTWGGCSSLLGSPSYSPISCIPLFSHFTGVLGGLGFALDFTSSHPDCFSTCMSPPRQILKSKRMGIIQILCPHKT